MALESSHTNANATDKQNSNYELLKRNEVENTPFIIISKGEEHFGTFGKFRITEIETNYEKLEKELKEITWNKIIQICGIITEIITEK